MPSGLNISTSQHLNISMKVLVIRAVRSLITATQNQFKAVTHSLPDRDLLPRCSDVRFPIAKASLHHTELAAMLGLGNRWDEKRIMVHFDYMLHQ
jgi:hypothetical protein